MRECPQCLGEVYSDESAACTHCGASLPPARPTTESSTPAVATTPPEADGGDEFARFRRQFEERSLYLPDAALQRAQEILHSATTELRRATVLLADIRSYSRLAREISAEELARYAGAFLEVASRCILARGGFIVEFLGDAVLAVFGAPVAFDHDTESAVRAALDLRESVDREPPCGRPTRIRVGIATGRIKSGRTDTPYGSQYRIVGDTVNLAARLQGVADTDEILVCETTRDVTARAFVSEPTAPLVLKNVSDNYTAHRVTREREREEALRDFSAPYCGRTHELQALEQFLSTPAGPTSAVAHVVGEAGIGKSRLVDEALHRAGMENRAVWWRTIPSETMILLGPALQWLRAELGLTAGDSPNDVRRAIRDLTAARAHDDGVDPLLLEFLFGVPDAVTAMRGMPPERVRRNLFGLLRTLLLSRATNAGSDPVILVADDVQWFDSMTRQFLSTLADWPDDTGVPAPLIILVYRSEAAPPIDLSPTHLRLRLKPLSESERHNLLKALTPTAEFLPEIRRIILSRATGNPLFIEEMTRLAREYVLNNANLNGEALAARIVDVLPVTLHDLIQSRIDRLDARRRQVLQCASLLGLEFTFSLIDMFETLRDGLSGNLQALRAMQYLGQLPDPRDLRYYFTHGLFRDVAYSMLLEEQKRDLHARLARRLEQVFTDRLQEYHELLAYHFQHAGDQRKALYHLVKAGDRQARMGASDSALENYLEAVQVLRQMPSTPDRQVLMTRILIRSGRLQRALGQGAESDELLASALECAQAAGNSRLELEARLEQVISDVWRGTHGTDVTDAVGHVIREAGILGAAGLESTALNTLGTYHYQHGEYEPAMRAYQRLAGMAHQAGVPHVEADAFNNAGLIYWRWGQLSEALAAFRQALPLRHKAADTFGLAATLMNIGMIQEQMGTIGAARKSYLNADALASRTGYGQALSCTATNLSNLERCAGTLSAAMEWGARALHFARECEDPALEAVAEENIAQALAEQGDTANARLHYLDALQIARQHRLLDREVGARTGLLEVLLADGFPNGVDAPGAQGGAGPITNPAEFLAETNAVLEQAQHGEFNDVLPRIYRLKGRALTEFGEYNARTAREYLELAREMSRNSGNLFEELSSLRELVAWAEATDQPDMRDQMSRAVTELGALLRH